MSTRFMRRCGAVAALAAAAPGAALAHGIGFTNTRIFMDQSTIATLTERAVPGLTSSDQVSFVIAVDTTLLNGPVGYFTAYIQPGATVTNAEFVNSAFATIAAAAPSAMETGYGARGVRTFTNWTATTGMGSIAVLNGDTGIFYSIAPITAVYNPNADGTISTNVPGASIKTTSQLMGITATHNLWDANQTRAFGAGTANAVANTPSTAPVVNTVGTGTTPFNTGSAVAGPDVGYSLDNTGAVGPWRRVSYPNSYTTLGSPNAAAPVTVQGVLAVVGTPTTAGAAFPLPSGTNAVRWAIGAPRYPGTYYVRVTLAFSDTLINSTNGIIVNSEATGSDADGIQAGKDNVWRYYQPAATTTAGSSPLFVAKDIIAVNDVPTLNPATVTPGAKLTYRIRYMNIGGMPQTNVVLSDTVPAQISGVCASITNVVGTSATAVSNSCPAAGSTVTFNIGNRLNVGQGGAVTFDMQTVSSSNLTLTNSARVTTTQNTAGVTAARSTLLQMPDLTINKSHVGNFNQGQVGAQYTITVNNTGNFDTNGLITVTDTLPASLTATAATGTGWTCVVGAPTTCTRSDPLAAATSYPPITLTVNVAANAPTPVTNAVAVSGGGETNTANSSTTDPTTVTARPDLTIAKSHVGNFTQGTNGSYTLTVSNIGTVATTGTITVTDTLPTGLSYVSATGTGFTCSAAGQVVTCTRTTALNAAANVAITLTTAVAANAASPVQNTAQVSGGNEINTANNTASDNTVILQRPLVAKAFTPSTVAVNAPSVLTVTISNPNPVAMTLAATAFTDSYPSGLFNTATPAPATTCGGTVSAAAGGASLSLANGTIAANSSCTVTVNVRSAAAGSYLNNTGAVATVGVGSGASASATLTVIAPAAPAISKAFSPNPIENTIPTTLTITFVNPNPISIADVAFSDNYPSGFANTTTPNAAFTPASVAAGCTGTITGGAAGGTSIGLAGGVMPANATCAISVSVVAPLVGSFLNTTSAVSTTNAGITATGGSASSTLTVVSPSPPFISKDFVPATVGMGEISRLTFTIVNPNGSRAIVGVAFADTYPTGLVNAPTPNVASTCTNGTITGGVAGGNSIALSGADIPILESCTVAVDVVAASTGSLLNTSGNVSSTDPLVGTGNTASATLNVIDKPSISKAFSPTAIVAGDVSTLTLTLSNLSATALSDVAFTDTFPAALTVASPNALNNTCGGAVSAAPGSGGVSLTGGVLAAGASCSVSVAVTSSVGGVHANTSGGVSSAQSGAAGAPSNTATLAVLARPTIAKAFSPSTVATSVASTLMLTISNPNAVALSGLAFTDNFPSGLLVDAAPSVGNTCGGSVAAAAGGATLSLSGGALAANASCTVSVAVNAALVGSYVNASGGVASDQTGAPGNPSNAATLTVTLPGVPVSGYVYSDANHNLQRDAGEAGTGQTLYAKLVQTATGPALQAVAVDPATGAYQFAAVPAGTYRLLIDNNPTLADISPMVPTGWIGTQAGSFARTNVVVADAAVNNLNFGAFNGSRLTGRVFEDTGVGGGVPNDGVQNGAETGIARVTVRATDAAGTPYDTTSTDGAGGYTLWIPATASAVRIAEVNATGYVSVGGAAGTTGGAYSRSTDATTFTTSAGTVYSGVNFADVRDNTLGGEGRQNVAPGGVVFYAHTFTPGSGGTVSFSADSIASPATAGVFTQAFLRDLDCNGLVDIGEPALAPSTPITVQAGVPVCVIVKDNAPGNAPLGAVNVITLSADFSYTNAAPSLLTSYTRHDVTTVGSGDGLSLLKTQSTSTPLPGTQIVYTIFYTNNGASALTLIRVRDATPSYTRFVSALCGTPLPASLSGCTVTQQPAAGGVGTIEWALAGALAPAAQGQVQFTVQVDP